MLKPSQAFLGANIHDGETLHRGHMLIADAAGQVAAVPEGPLPEGCVATDLAGGTIMPGYVDLQVNGGGGVMFNDAPKVETLQQMAAAHAALGTAAFLPTLITDTRARTEAAITAVIEAQATRLPGIVGLHLEGPHLAVSRKGAHDGALIRPMEDEDLQMLLRAADRIATLKVTLAPENASLAQIKTLSDAGVVVFLGHTDADYETCMAAFDAGAKGATHLFNAMSQLTNRAPGLVGAVLDQDDVFAGVIADGIHVHPATMRLALRAKGRKDRIFAVTDAMATAGSDVHSFALNGREIRRCGDRLTLADGTLAGAHLDLTRAIAVLTEQAGDSLETAMARTTSWPAALLRDGGNWGRLNAGLTHLVHLPDAAARPRWLT